MLDIANAISALTAIWGQKRWDWLENSNSSVSLDDRKLAQLIGNRQKLETAATSKIFSRQIPQYFSARKVHNRTVPLCSDVLASADRRLWFVAASNAGWIPSLHSHRTRFLLIGRNCDNPQSAGGEIGAVHLWTLKIPPFINLMKILSHESLVWNMCRLFDINDQTKR